MTIEARWLLRGFEYLNECQDRNQDELEWRKVREDQEILVQQFRRVSLKCQNFNSGLSHFLISTRSFLDRMMFFRINNNIFSFWFARDYWSLFLQNQKSAFMRRRIGAHSFKRRMRQQICCFELLQEESTKSTQNNLRSRIWESEECWIGFV